MKEKEVRDVNQKKNLATLHCVHVLYFSISFFSFGRVSFKAAWGINKNQINSLTLYRAGTATMSRQSYLPPPNGRSFHIYIWLPSSLSHDFKSDCPSSRAEEKQALSI